MEPHRADDLSIKTPCPKKWEELAGDERRRYCSACALHVWNGARLRRAEAQALVVGATERVCMRLELDPTGAPRFADSPQPRPGRAPLHTRVLRLAASAAGLLLAACTRESASTTCPAPDPAGGPAHATTLMGKIASPEVLGDVAVPAAPTPVRMGEVEAVPPPVAPPR